MFSGEYKRQHWLTQADMIALPPFKSLFDIILRVKFFLK